MVMRNRYDGPNGRDDMPPRIRERLRPQRGARTRETSVVPPSLAPTPTRGAWVGDAIILGLVFLALAVTNLVVLVMALVILRGSVGPF